MGLALSSSKIFLANILVAVVSFVGTIYFARYLGPAIIGIYFLFEALLRLLGAVTDAGFRNALEKRLSEGREATEIIGTTVAIKSIALGLVIIGIVLFRGWINAYLNAQLALYLVGMLIVYELANLQFKILFGQHRGEETAPIVVAQHLVWLCLGAVLLSYDFGLKGLLIALFAGLLVKFLWGAMKQPPALGSPSWATARSLFEFARYNVVTVFGRYFYNWIDLLLIGVFLTTTSVAKYEVAWRVAGVTILLSRSISLVLLPKISSLYEKGELRKIESFLPKAQYWAIALVLPAFVASLVLSEEIIMVLFGAEYVSAWAVLIVVIGGKVFQAEHVVLERSLQAIDKPSLSARANVGGMVTNVALNLVLIYSFGILGAAVATSMGYLCSALLHYVYIRRDISVRLPGRLLGWSTVASLGMGGCLWLLKRHITPDSIPLLALFVATGVVAYVALLGLYQPLRDDIFSALSSANRI